ncbi:MAG: hypothetical protein GY757_02700, partial [bacterium]|nr:hypothetical protein [bacterium]
VATIVTLIGFAHTYKEKWEHHLLLTISLFFAYHLYWVLQLGGSIDKPTHLLGIFSVASVGILAMLVHYRSLYKTDSFELKPFFIHFVNWIFLGIGLYFHSTGSFWKPLIIGVASIAAFFLARRARRTGIQWLYLTDTMVAQVIALIAFASLYRLEVEPFFIVGFMLLETMLFLVIMIKENEKLLCTVGTFVKYGLGIVMMVWGFENIWAYEQDILSTYGVMFLICAVAGALFHLYPLKKYGSGLQSLFESEGYKWLHALVYYIYVFFAVGAVFLALGQWYWNPAALAFLAVIAFSTARRARTTGLRKLYLAGTLVAQGVTMLALATLTRWNVDGFLITGLMLLQIMLFLVMTIKENEKLLCAVGTFLKYGVAIVLMGMAFNEASLYQEGIFDMYGGMLVICAILVTLFHLYPLKKFGGNLQELSDAGDYRWLPNLLYFVYAFFAVEALFFFMKEWYWNPAGIGLLAIIAFLTAKYAKTTGVHKLYLTGTLVAQAMALLALVGLYLWNVDHFFIVGLVFLEIVIFLVAMIREKEKILCGTGVFIKYCTGFVLMAMVLNSVGAAEVFMGHNPLMLLLAITLLATLFHLSLLWKFGKSYKELIESNEYNWLSPLLYFLNWMYAGAAVYLFIIGWWWKPVVLGVLSITGFITAKWSKKLGIHGLYRTLTLVAQGLALAGLGALFYWNLNPEYITGLMFVEILVFLFAMIKEKEKVLCSVGTLLKYVLSLGLLGWMVLAVEYKSGLLFYRPLGIMLLAALLATVFHLFLVKKYANVSEGFLKSRWMPASVYYLYIFFTGVTGSLYISEWHWKPVAIAVLSLTAFFTAKWGKVNGLTTLHRAGSLTAQALAIIALTALTSWGVDPYFILGLIFIEIILFLLLAIREDEDFLKKTGNALLLITCGLLVAVALEYMDYENTAVLLKHAGVLLACVVTGTIFHLYTIKKFGETFDSFKWYSKAKGIAGSELNREAGTGPESEQKEHGHNISFLGLFIGWLLFTAYINTYRMSEAGYVLAAVGVGLIYLRWRFKSTGLGVGLILFVLVFHCFGWEQMVYSSDSSLMARLIYSLPFLALSFAGLRMPYLSQGIRGMKALGVHLFYAHLAIAAYFCFNPVSVFIPGLLWLLFSLIILESTCWLRRKHGDGLLEKGETDRFLIHAGYFLIAAFIVRHIMVHMKTVEYFGNVPLRIVAVAFAIVVFLYWTFRNVPERKDSSIITVHLRPLFLELVFIFTVLTIVIDIQQRWYPLIWIVMALFCMLAGRVGRVDLSRMR